METAKLKKFAQFARRSLIEQVSSKLKLVLAAESNASREHPAAVKKLEEAIQESGKEQVIERVAYIWFNRFCALRFMDVNRYTRIGVVSPAEGQFQPEILAEAKMGHIDEEMVQDKVRQQVFALLDGKAPSRDPQSEAYRLLVVAACNAWNKAMPFLFQRIDDYTELLMPDDLLSGNSILAYTREAMTPEACLDVEVIGWLYQFYISEKKDQVFNVLNKKNKITPENIPAATQLFTPHWIVRYLVENSLGRLWLLNRPDSRIFANMKERGEDCYYIEPEQPETDFLKISSPEEIKICDPACGSGHMLTYAFDLLYAIYEEEGYEPSEIPEKILTHNLFGIEIDERAGELAAFALTMKARAKQRRFFNKGVKPNICVLENVRFEEDELKNYMDFVGRDLFTAPLQSTLHQFEETDNFGSLIRPDVTGVNDMLRVLESKDVSGQLFISMTHQKVLQALQQTEYLSSKYHVVVANPPYMGLKGMNSRLATWLSDNYSKYKSDLFSSFIVRCTELAKKRGMVGVMCPNVWMYIYSHESLRQLISSKKDLTTLVELPLSGFKGATVQICAFAIRNSDSESGQGAYIRLVDFKGDEEEMSRRALDAVANKDCTWRFMSDSRVFSKIPGSQIAYWVSGKMIHNFSLPQKMGDISHAFQGIITGDNAYFLRLWHELDNRAINTSFKNYSDAEGNNAWVPYNKGGSFRRWYGNCEHLLRWNGYGNDLTRGRTENRKHFFKEGLTWSDITSFKCSFRNQKTGILFDAKGPTAIYAGDQHIYVLGLMNSIYAERLIELLNPTLSFQIDDFYKVPIISSFFEKERIKEIVHKCISLSLQDWDAYETSWDFNSIPILNPDYHHPAISTTYQRLRAHWQGMVL